MDLRRIGYLTSFIYLWLYALCAFASPSPFNFTYHDKTLVITNHSANAINLRHAIIDFTYGGRVHTISAIDNRAQTLGLSVQAMSTDNSNKLYSIKLNGTQNTLLYPTQSLKFALVTDNRDVPHDFNLTTAPTPVPVRVTVANTQWVTKISICNTTTNSIPLKNIEFNFNYASPMPTSIWGSPWVNWRLASQTGTQVVLVGGTANTPDLPSDLNCMRPLTIKFNASPTTPIPTGPFVFKTEGATPPATGTLNINVAAAPAVGLPNPTLTVTGPGTTQQRVVNWGTTWSLTLAAGTYRISGASITVNGKPYSADTMTAVVGANTTVTQTVTYVASTVPPTTTPVTISLVNPPSTQVPVSFVGALSTVNQNVTNGTVVNLPNDSYTVTSTVSGYTATATPNPLVTPGNQTLQLTYTAIPTSDVGSRTVNFVNQCSFPVWFGFISGATPNKSGGETCTSDADCHPNNVCVNRGAAGNHCFWRNPVPANNNYQLAANGGTNSVVIPYVDVPMKAVFSGAAAGRTNCTAAGCETADCSAGVGGCPPGKGFKQPATQLEFTFNTENSDYYNTSAVNGMNIPAAMSVVNAPVNANDPYSCGAPGSATGSALIGGCSYDFQPPLVEFNWVRAGGNACTSDANCAAGTKCGLSKNPGQTPLLKKTCGKLLGYWNANQICGEQKNYGEPFNCQSALPGQAGTMINLYGCFPIDSCYKNGAPSTCCGCANWDLLGIKVAPAPYTKQCTNSNPTWTTKVLPGLDWIKRACPSTYVYPFDDMSSTFVCRILKDRNGKQVNSVNYTITFCPGGKTGGIS